MADVADAKVMGSDTIGSESTSFEVAAEVRSGLEPELGGIFRHGPERTGLEPELGGSVRQRGVYVDEVTCIGCLHCSHVARNTFFIEPSYGRSRAISQNSDTEELIQEAIDTCPVDCIHWVDFTELKRLEAERPNQEIAVVGIPVQPRARRNRRRSPKSTKN